MESVKMRYKVRMELLAARQDSDEQYLLSAPSLGLDRFRPKASVASSPSSCYVDS